MFRNLKMSVKLMLGFGITVAISAVMMLFAIMNLQSVGGLTDKLYQSPFTVSTQSIMLKGASEYWQRDAWDGSDMKTPLISIPCGPPMTRPGTIWPPRSRASLATSR